MWLDFVGAQAHLGKFLDSLREFFGMHLLEDIAHLAADVQAKTQEDFMEGVRHLNFMFTIKFGFWEDLPYSLCGIASAEEADARAAGQRCLVLFEHLPQGLQKAHSLTQRWLAVGSPLRDQLVLFVQGVARDDPRLAALKRGFKQMVQPRWPMQLRLLQ